MAGIVSALPNPRPKKMSRSIDVEQFRKKLVAMTALFKQGQLQECRAHCEVLAKQFPNEPNTANLLGATYAALGMDAAAYQIYEVDFVIARDA